jgi:hypothetical protein
MEGVNEFRDPKLGHFAETWPEFWPGLAAHGAAQGRQDYPQAQDGLVRAQFVTLYAQVQKRK